MDHSSSYHCQSEQGLAVINGVAVVTIIMAAVVLVIAPFPKIFLWTKQKSNERYYEVKLLSTRTGLPTGHSIMILDHKNEPIKSLEYTSQPDPTPYLEFKYEAKILQFIQEEGSF